jgi:hypothetical protein
VVPLKCQIFIFFKPSFFLCHTLAPESEMNLLDALHMFPDIDETPCLRADEYVRILRDVLVFGKNLYVTRNLEKLPYYLIGGGV